MKRISIACLLALLFSGCAVTGQPEFDLQLKMHPDTRKVYGEVIVSFRPAA